MKGDDGAGPELVRLLDGRTGAACIDAGVAPENHLERIVALRPDVVLLVDVMDFGARPGSTILVAGSEGGGGGLSSHAVPLSTLSEYIEARLGRPPLILGIQPASFAQGASLSATVSRTVRRLAEMLAETLAGAWQR